MEKISIKNKFKPGRIISGYEIKTVTPLESIDSDLIELEHIKTRARHIHILNSDKENTFGIFFRTVPTDSTGVAHILEHTVLCGSKNYNVRDPFFSMLKRSLSTFMNAFTASDWTMYPFSTQNKKDYYNLMEVYLDAAFFPNIDELSFKQEGHRLEVNRDSEGRMELEYKGVVYNEMKGAMSSPSQVMGRSLLSFLYPDTTYKNNSGGEPSEIPDLTWEGLKNFHATYYHPSNACFYTYGDLPLEETLEVISKKILEHFDYLEVDSRVPAQPRWKEPKTAGQAYAFSDPENIAKKYQSCVAWLTCDIKDTFETLVLTVLEQILIGNAASPLRKALIDSGLGSSLSDGSGFDPDNRDTMFACGLKDIEKSSVSEVENIIFKTLRSLVNDGISPELVDSAIHQIEFHRKEITNTPYPFGLKLLLSMAGTLIHEGNPVDCINIDSSLNRLKQEIKKGNFLEKKLEQYFLNNPHRIVFTLEPDRDLEKKTSEKTKLELKSILSRLSPHDIEKIDNDALQLEKLQESQEDISVLPTLEINDIPPEIEIIKPDQIAGVRHAAGYDKATSGILYFTCPVGAGNISSDLFRLVPFFCRTFTNCGTKLKSYEKMAGQMDLYTGGINLAPFSGTYFSNEGGAHSFLALQGKSLDRNLDRMFELISEFVLEFSFHDAERIKNLLLQYRAGLEASIVSTGHRYAISLASRNISKASHINEMWHGIAQYQFINEITEKLASPEQADKTLEKLSRDFAAIAGSVFKKGNFKPAVIGSADSILKADQHISRIHDSLSGSGRQAFTSPDIQFSPDLVPFDGWYTNTSVSFSGLSFKTVGITHADSPGLAVISKLLRSLFLHREIREKGGAYGGFAIYNTEEGIFSMSSYRDPHINRTIDVYRRACDFIIKGDYSSTDIKEAVLQVCSEIDKPETPGPAAMKAFYRDIAKLDDDMRKKFKDALLKLDKPRIQNIAEEYFTVEESKKGISVISSRTLLEQANQELAEKGRTLDLKKI